MSLDSANLFNFKVSGLYTAENTEVSKKNPKHSMMLLRELRVLWSLWSNHLEPMMNFGFRVEFPSRVGLGGGEADTGFFTRNIVIAACRTA
jgi:hypothetical protein